jgi:hypothetical protein
MKRLLLLLIFFLPAGCGRKGQLIPPEALLPVPIADLQVAQEGGRFRVSWSLPPKPGGGGAHRELAGFRLFKREVLPPDQDCEACADAYRLAKSVDLDYLQDVRRSGDRLLTSDSDIALGTTYQYKVVAVNKDGTVSPDSNRARRRMVTPPAAPRLQAKFTPTEVLLSWEESAPPANGKLVGYNIFRWRKGAPAALAPLNSTPDLKAGFEDTKVEPRVAYVYVVRTVAAVDGETAESEPSNEVEGVLSEPD